MLMETKALQDVLGGGRKRYIFEKRLGRFAGRGEQKHFKNEGISRNVDESKGPIIALFTGSGNVHEK
jgi:hypothetical protein